MTRAVAIIDYDNVVDDRREKNRDDAEANVRWVVGLVGIYCRSVLTNLEEVDIRLYGGWLDEKTQWTPRAQYLLSVLSLVRGRRDHALVRLMLCSSVAASSMGPLRGLCRKRFDEKAQTMKFEQKMVDTMMAVDIVYLCEGDVDLLVVASDDDDLVPGVITASRRSHTPIHLLRRRPMGAGLNDHVCCEHGATIRPYPKWQES